MTINLTHGEKCQASLNLEIPADLVASTREEVLRQYLQFAKVPGYRPGKVPRKLVERRFQGPIQEELEKRLDEKAFREVREKEDLHILSVLEKKLTPNVDETYTITADLLVAPSFELPEYKGVPISLPSTEVQDEHVEILIERWQEQNADYKDLDDESATLEMGHYAVIDYTASKDGEPLVKEDSPPMFRAYFEREGAWMLMDEESFLPGFCGELLDHKEGEEFEFTLTLPENFAEEDLQGQEVQFKVTLKDIKQKDLPEFNDENVKEMTRGEFETAEDFRKDMQERLSTEAERHVRELRNQKALEYLHGLLDFDLPDMMVDQETQNHVNRIVNESQQQGVDEEALLDQEGKIVEAAGQMGRRDVKTKFILNEIATKEGLRVNDQELLQRVQAMAANARMSPKKAIRILRANGRMNSIAEEILFGKALDFVTENASVSTDEAQNALDQLLNQDGAA